MAQVAPCCFGWPSGSMRFCSPASASPEQKSVGFFSSSAVIREPNFAWETSGTAIGNRHLRTARRWWRTVVRPRRYPHALSCPGRNRRPPVSLCHPPDYPSAVVRSDSHHEHSTAVNLPSLQVREHLVNVVQPSFMDFSSEGRPWFGSHTRAPERPRSQFACAALWHPCSTLRAAPPNG